LKKVSGTFKACEKSEIYATRKVPDTFFNGLLVLCTKGVHTVLSDERILQVGGEYVEAQKCADALCKTALDGGSRDNASSMVVEV